MPDKYEVNVTIGVRQADRGPGSFQASDTIVMELTGFADLMDILAAVHDVAGQLRARATEPEDRRRR